MSHWRATCFCGLVLLLAGCSGAVSDAEQQYHMVEKNGNKDELCRAARAVQEAALKAHDEQRYNEWKLTADVDCLSARLSS